VSRCSRFETVCASEEFRLFPLTGDLEIDYTALSFAAPQKVRFRYKLEGRDAFWQEPGTGGKLSIVTFAQSDTSFA
jgi:hypothetical protein